MRAKCIANKGSDLRPSWLELGITPHSIHHISPGKEYAGIALSLWRGHANILICDDVDLRSWNPIDLFEIVDGRMPNWWRFASYRKPEGYLEALWGYPELIDLDSGHYDDLMDLKLDAIEIFNRERLKVKAWLETCCQVTG